MNERNQLEQAIAAQESLRGTLDDAIIDAAIATLREKLVALEPPPLQQRKLATILFADIVESTQLTQGLDPEEQMALIDPLVKRLAARVDEHSGHVCRYQVGLPVAHENDPAQAIRAGLAIQAEADKIAKELQIERGLGGFQVRVGISTGLVFSGGETEGEDTVKGEPVNLAKRLESAAQPGTVLISHDSYKHVRGLFGVKPLDSIEAKGFPEPMVVYRVKSHKPRSFYRGMRGVEGVETRMVGRELELLQLQKILEDVIDGNRGRGGRVGQVPAAVRVRELGRSTAGADLVLQRARPAGDPGTAVWAAA
jgi:class 3 adenylate cyclase